MPHRIPQSIAIRVPLQAFLASDHLTPATGKTIPITISKNGAAFGNPSAGATNATEIGNGWYYVDLSTTDSGSLGPLIVRGPEATIDTINHVYQVVDPHSMGADYLYAPPTDWLAAAAVKADAVTKIQAGLSTFAAGGNVIATNFVEAPSAASVAAEVLSEMNATPPGVDVKKLNGQTIDGDGSEATPWGKP